MIYRAVVGRVGQVQHKAPVVALGGAQIDMQRGRTGWHGEKLEAYYDAGSRRTTSARLSASEQLRSEEDTVKWLRLVAW
jgi:hypothetical protein